MDCAATMLKSLLDCAGQTYLVVDGLDEMEMRERQRLLSQLVKLSNECEPVKILVCSRAENDIDRVLGSLPRIRADHNNSDSIETFVKSQTAEWLDQRYFLPEEKSEIEVLLAPVASKARGMFLYAKVLFSCLELLSDVQEVRKELVVLPKDLNAA